MFRNLTIDHLLPRSEGGAGHIDNLQLLCGACNSAKGAGSQGELIVKLKGLGSRDLEKSPFRLSEIPTGEKRPVLERELSAWIIAGSVLVVALLVLLLVS